MSRLQSRPEQFRLITRRKLAVGEIEREKPQPSNFEFAPAKQMQEIKQTGDSYNLLPPNVIMSSSPEDIDIPTTMVPAAAAATTTTATSSSSTGSSNTCSRNTASAAPTPLNFDDGSRIMMMRANNGSSATGGDTNASANVDGELSTEACGSRNANAGTCRSANERGSTPLEYYYEIDRLASEIASKLGLELGQGGNSGVIGRDDGFLCRVALQFPDELLADAADVSHLLERTLTDHVLDCNDRAPATPPPPPLVFILGDTTYGSCCPDEIGAQHLDADILVHFGTRACLGPTETLPVVYSFGRRMRYNMQDGVGPSGSNSTNDTDEQEQEQAEECTISNTSSLDTVVDRCVDLVIVEANNEKKKERNVDDTCTANKSFLVLYEVQHWQLAEAVTNRLNEQHQVETICGRIPDYPSGDAGTTSTDEHECSRTETCNCSSSETTSESQTVVIGGLVVPSDIRLSDYTLLYIGDASGEKNGSRQFLNILLHCCSPGGTGGCWAYGPYHKPETIDTDPASSLSMSRYLNRRYYLIQKTKMASIIGILVGTLSQKRFRSVIDRVRLLVEESGRSCYTFAVGKVNVAKLANYAEIEAFVLIGCTESSVLDDEREFHVPIVTPMELEVALGEREWDGFYSHAFSDFLGVSDNNGDDDAYLSKSDLEDENKLTKDASNDDNNEYESDGDEPFFSPISGKYESVGGKAAQKYANNVDLRSLPGGGQVTEYKSGAAEFWQEREYKGLEAAVGTTAVQAAVQGQTGIASDYGEVVGRGAKQYDDSGSK